MKWDSQSFTDYVGRLRSINHPLKMLVENEISRLNVWANPTNDPKRGTDHVGTAERSLTEVVRQFFRVSVGSIYTCIPGLLVKHHPHSVADRSRYRNQSD